MKVFIITLLLLLPTAVLAEDSRDAWVADLETSCSKDVNGNLPRKEPNKGCTCLARGFVYSSLGQELYEQFGERYINEFILPLINDWNATVEKLANEEATTPFGQKTLAMTFDISRSCMKQLSGEGAPQL